jgi:hypothetical protein
MARGKSGRASAHTKCGGNTRLFYRWEGKRLTDSNWRQMGIAMEADTNLGETKGGLQAPHVFVEKDRYYMVYGDWQRICLATSRDGKTFTRVPNERGQPDLFSGPYDNTRDPMVLELGDLFTATTWATRRARSISPRFSVARPHDLKSWSEPMIGLRRWQRGGTHQLAWRRC